MPLCSQGSARRRNPLPPAGSDAPTPAREKGLQPYGARYCFGWRSEGGAGGNEGKRVSSGYNRRRRLAPRSSGKQQAEHTAVRAAPIVCPEESPPACSNRQQLCRRNYPWWGMTRRLRRGLGLAVPWGALSLRVAIRRGAGGERKAPCLHDKRQLCRKKFPFDRA